MNDLLSYERELFARGIKFIAGVDEVGRGPLAGPFVAAAVILDLEKLLSAEFTFNDVPHQNFGLYKLINDSKKVTEKNREILSKFIIENAVSYSIIEIPVTQLDEWGISKTTQEAFYQAVTNLKVKPQHVLVDGFEIKKITHDNQSFMAKGDSKSMTIAAASIIAKVYRDRKMCELHDKYPEYGFDKHKGYGTKAHMDAIKAHGICEIHRKSFEPIRSMLL